MKIGDEVYIHGYIDEIRNDTVIIKNDGGYFGTVEPEVVLNQPESCGDAVSREEAKWGVFCNCDHAKNQANAFDELPSAQQEAISLEWIDKHLEWLDNCDNDFAQLAKVGIMAMVELWKKDRT